jgi:hypothetical protein
MSTRESLIIKSLEMCDAADRGYVETRFFASDDMLVLLDCEPASLSKNRDEMAVYAARRFRSVAATAAVFSSEDSSASTTSRNCSFSVRGHDPTGALADTTSNWPLAATALLGSEL